jgi:hypothetical protein
MKKITFLSVCLLLLVLTGRTLAQVSFNHGIGLFYAVGPYHVVYEDNNVDYDVSGALGGPGLVYNPRLNLFGGDKSTFSVGTHIGFGFAGSANSREGGSGSIVVDITLILNLNFGAASSPDNTNGFGGFVGAGFGFNKMASTDSDVPYGGSTGPIFDGGVRILLKNRFYQVRVSYLLDMSGDEKTKEEIKDPKVNVFTIGISRILGMQG